MKRPRPLQRLRRHLRGRLAEERGVALILITLLLVVFMGMAAFAIDLGWLYFNSLEIQHGADAGALAGVIYEPDDRPAAYTEAIGAARENGYVDGSLGGPDVVDPTDFTEDPSAVENTHQLRVTVSSDVSTFFMRVFGIDTVNITRTALAEYVLPLPLGSPDDNFGNDPAAGHWPNFWGNIHGYYTGRGMGDRYSSQCVSWQSGSGCTPNPDARPSSGSGTPSAAGGYLYGVKVEPGASNLTVDVFDGPFTRGGGDQWLVGDNPQGSSPGPTTVFMLYGPDPTPADTTDGNELLCVETFAPRDPYADFNGDGSINNGDDQDGDGDLDFDDVEIGLAATGGVASLWDRMCSGTNFDRGPGIYPLRVMVPPTGERGLNRWSMRANASGVSPSIFGLGDMAIYANVDGTLGNTIFYLAEVEEVHAGKDLVVDLWDPGDASGNHSVRIIDPHGNTPGCEYTSSNPSYGGTLGTCDIPTSGSRFNDHWIQVRIDLPAGYTCAADCWWRIDYNYPAQTNDTTTWSARIDGNPVRLVE